MNQIKAVKISLKLVEFLFYILFGTFVIYMVSPQTLRELTGLPKFVFEILVGVFSIGALIFYFLDKKYPQESDLSIPNPISDEQKLLDLKRKYLDKILTKLKIEIDNELDEYLSTGEIEEAGSLIEDKIKALDKLVDIVKGDTTKSLIGTDISNVSQFYESTNARIRTEISRIQISADKNKSIGIFTSIVAFFLLLISLPNLSKSLPFGLTNTFEKLLQVHKYELIEIIPRITLAILVEAFAFYFFRQYTKEQEDIKYWNNEKTNLDLKIFALSIAIDDSDIGTPDYMRGVITDLLNRNTFTETPNSQKTKENGDDIKEKTMIDEMSSKLKEILALTEKK